MIKKTHISVPFRRKLSPRLRRHEIPKLRSWPSELPILIRELVDLSSVVMAGVRVAFQIRRHGVWLLYGE